MAINSDKPGRWLDDINASVKLFNDWFTIYAPLVYGEVRERIRGDVLHAFDVTEDLRNVRAQTLRTDPGILPVLRQATAPPLAVDRLVGLAGVGRNLVCSMENGSLPTRMSRTECTAGLEAIAEVISRMLDFELFVWLDGTGAPNEIDRVRAASVIADRLTLSIANPIIRNAQEKRQLDILARWLNAREYQELRHSESQPLQSMEPGTYARHMNVEGGKEGEVKVSIDVVIQPHRPRPSGLPILIEAKSAGDFTNVNKRRKEEADKYRHLRERHGDAVEYLLFLGGYFDRGYLEYEARAGIDWIWEHRPDDLDQLGLDARNT